MKKPDGTFIVGIDLGTTYSLVSTIDDGRPSIIPNEIGELLTPSAVALDDSGALLVGAAARALAERRPEICALSFKRDMGTPAQRKLGNESLGAIELSALILKSLKADAEAVLGGEVSEAVITVPAYFGDAQRTATRDAAELAGLKCQRLINEPTAAALAHGFQNRDAVAQIAVLDLGGGTFDVTLLEIDEGVIEIQASAGDMRLGGDEFTAALAETIKALLAEDELRSEHHHLQEVAERAKKQLSKTETAQLVVFCAGQSEPWHGQIDRASAAEAWAPLLKRMVGPIERALGDAGWGVSEASGVLLVGGSSRIPQVQELVSKLFGRPGICAERPDETVGLGAAIQAALMISEESVEDIVATDVAPFTLGIATCEDIRGRLVRNIYSPILERGTVLPASRASLFHTLHPSQTEILLEIYQGEHPIAERNTALGRVSVRNLPPGHINSVEVRFSYDLNGLLEVEAIAAADDAVTRTVIDRSTGKMSAAERTRILQRFERLKVHPKTLLPNRVALERGESAYGRLLGEERARLGFVLANFRVALAENQDIEETREALIRFLRELV